MKKGISIALAFLIFTAMFHLTVATHYCGGKAVASKISLTGKLADCGMESRENKLPPSGTYITTHCCDDVVTYCGTDNNYTPSFSFFPNVNQYNSQIFGMTTGYPVFAPAVFIPIYASAAPPGAMMSTDVDLSDICVFRI